MSALGVVDPEKEEAEIFYFDGMTDLSYVSVHQYYGQPGVACLHVVSHLSEPALDKGVREVCPFNKEAYYMYMHI